MFQELGSEERAENKRDKVFALMEFTFGGWRAEKFRP